MPPPKTFSCPEGEVEGHGAIVAGRMVDRKVVCSTSRCRGVDAEYQDGLKMSELECAVVDWGTRAFSFSSSAQPAVCPDETPQPGRHSMHESQIIGHAKVNVSGMTALGGKAAVHVVSRADIANTWAALARPWR